MTYRIGTKAYRHNRRKTTKGKYEDLKDSARTRGLIVQISYEMYSKIILNPCFYCETPVSNLGGHSLDRIDNSLGYSENNVLPCCGECNKIRGPFLTIQKMKVAMMAILKYRKSTGI